MSARDDYPLLAEYVIFGGDNAVQHRGALDEIDFLRGFEDHSLREHIEAAFDETWRSIYKERYEFHREVFLDKVEQIIAIHAARPCNPQEEKP